MNRTYTIVAAGLSCLAAYAQAPGTPAGRVEPVLAQQLPAAGARGIMAAAAPRSEPGRPYSATVTTQTTQVLADGTRVSQTTTRLEYRDAEGRVRTETNPNGAANEGARIITIRDPVASVTYRLDPGKKTANRLELRQATVGNVAGARGAGGGGAVGEFRMTTPVEPAQVAGGFGGGGAGGRGRGAATPGVPSSEVAPQNGRNNPNELVEDLGTMTVNGVAARGTRVTTVIPVGAIGNDREFRSVSERWFSPDLNMLVKSVNNDPRFGTTTYELTNISRNPPDPSLFKLPADYTVSQ